MGFKAVLPHSTPLYPTPGWSCLPGNHQEEGGSGITGLLLLLGQLQIQFQLDRGCKVAALRIPEKKQEPCPEHPLRAYNTVSGAERNSHPKLGLKDLPPPIPNKPPRETTLSWPKDTSRKQTAVKSPHSILKSMQGSDAEVALPFWKGHGRPWWSWNSSPHPEAPCWPQAPFPTCGRALLESEHQTGEKLIKAGP
jgi:hypothetical protein